ncbi:hypothetical protein [Alkalimarinus alittae]|uniref:Uncharacterized protein n=1 Tax=Alkalimarinus alittae TaxID=2961619 RepID=A0ABY6N2Q8_9ALTE|nr:hypothetical protein [Alkalimarinus alittae]UZE96277.1 hypothetical protein NKI27_00595 [Alkalimarinus alittae]
MRLEEAKKSNNESILVAADIVPNSAKKGDWVLLMKERDGKSHFLVTDNDEIQSFKSIDDAVKALQHIGYRRAKLFF